MVRENVSCVFIPCKFIWEHKHCRDVIWLKERYFEGFVYMASYTRHNHPLV